MHDSLDSSIPYLGKARWECCGKLHTDITRNNRMLFDHAMAVSHRMRSKACHVADKSMGAASSQVSEEECSDCERSLLVK